MENQDPLLSLLAALGIAPENIVVVDLSRPKCPGPVTVWKDEDLKIQRCACGTVGYAVRPLEAGQLPGKMRRNAGAN